MTDRCLLVVHHSPSPSMQALTQAVLAGAGDDLIEGVRVLARPALEATAADVLAADGLVLGTPANFGYMSGALKHFFDSTFLQVGGALGDDGSAGAAGTAGAAGAGGSGGGGSGARGRSPTACMSTAAMTRRARSARCARSSRRCRDARPRRCSTCSATSPTPTARPPTSSGARSRRCSATEPAPLDMRTGRPRRRAHPADDAREPPAPRSPPDQRVLSTRHPQVAAGAARAAAGRRRADRNRR